MPLIRIMADSFGQNRPETFVTVGPAARLLQTPAHLRGTTGGAPLLTPAKVFTDNVNIIEVVPPTPVRLFHLCLTRHAAITVGGIEMETFHPGMGATRQVTHAQRDLFLSMFPHIAHITDFGPLAHPRAPEDDLASGGQSCPPPLRLTWPTAVPAHQTARRGHPWPAGSPAMS